MDKFRSADFMINIKNIRDFSWQGKVEHLPSGQEQTFENFLELLFLMERKMEELGSPQEATEKRSWKK
ncbi:MAG: hypothetical protein D5R97_09980 [Candidatus Syntrophonatronum acetioxidans]|uniref:Uncharacterized protein n=1 Tax=Candidatus Syntrophonatronum acetioxidans TaxID=1795816 RepID=A0A424Y9R8_9FIRM|nr:MAG: hypothetical protein D5R97_09980 [Candidatus Syntrophonatronum acetioxidans]